MTVKYNKAQTFEGIANYIRSNEWKQNISEWAYSILDAQIRDTAIRIVKRNNDVFVFCFDDFSVLTVDFTESKYIAD